MKFKILHAYVVVRPDGVPVAHTVRTSRKDAIFAATGRHLRWSDEQLRENWKELRKHGYRTEPVAIGKRPKAG